MRFNQTQENEPIVVDGVVVEETGGTTEVAQYVQETQLALRKDPNVIALSKGLDITQQNAILSFGEEASRNTSTFSDRILSQIEGNSSKGTGEVMTALTNIIKRVDVDELRRIEEEEESKGFLSKLFSKGKNSIESLLGQYKTLGNDIGSIHMEMSRHKAELSSTNQALETMFEENMKYYTELEKYIVAGNMIIEEVEREDMPYLMDKAQSGDQRDIQILQDAQDVLELMKQRVYNLEMAKMMALQTAPQIRMIQRGNNQLIAQIHSSFIITIPAFKSALINAIAIKQQKEVKEATDALTEATNQIVKQNASNIKKQSIEIAKSNGQTLLKQSTLEESWNLIVSGAEEVYKIEQENSKNREQGITSIHQLQNNMQKQLIDKTKTQLLESK